MCVVQFIFIYWLLIFNLNLFSTSGQSNTNHSNAHYWGSLETYAGNSYSIENITITPGRTNSMKVYEKPVNHEKPIADEKGGITEIPLSYNPQDRGGEIIIELEDFEALSVPNPDIVWIKKKSSGRTKAFVEIEVSAKGSQEKKSYLALKSLGFHVDIHGTKMDMNIGIEGVKELKIEGVKIDLPEKKEEKK